MSKDTKRPATALTCVVITEGKYLLVRGSEGTDLHQQHRNPSEGSTRNARAMGLLQHASLDVEPEVNMKDLLSINSITTAVKKHGSDIHNLNQNRLDPNAFCSTYDAQCQNFKSRRDYRKNFLRAPYLLFGRQWEPIIGHISKDNEKISCILGLKKMHQFEYTKAENLD